MAKAPRPGFAKTRLIPALGAAGAAALAEAFIADTAALLRRAGVDAVVIATPPEAVDLLSALTGFPAIPQREGDLGARMSGAFADLFARGHAPVLLVGTDSPTQPPAHVTAALALCVADPEALVLGPAEDGGYWCVGLSRPVPGVFDGIAWGTGSVLGETRARAARLGVPVVLGPRWHDVDEQGDLERLRRELADDPPLAPHTRAVLGRAP
jgi:rSAM/selenodomain-associated transferase 1